MKTMTETSHEIQARADALPQGRPSITEIDWIEWSRSLTDALPCTTEHDHPLDATYFYDNGSLYFRPLSKKAERAFANYSPSPHFPGCYGFVCMVMTLSELTKHFQLLVAPEDTQSK
jgi:hypothetical protein